MRSRGTLCALSGAAVVLTAFLLAADVMARGGGRGGGGFSRGGGGFSRGGGSIGRAGGLGAGRPTPNISRRGPATGGSFGGRASARPGGGFGSGPGGALGSGPGGSNPRPTTRPITRPTTPDTAGDRQQGWTDRQGSRQEGRTERQENRQEGRSDRLDDRLENREEARKEYAEYVDDHTYTYEEYYEDRWRYSVGASLTAVHFHNLSCTTSTVVVGSVTYYHCGSTWYNRAYSGGNVTYIVVNPPPGH